VRKDVRDLPFLAVAIVLGLAIGWVYLHTDEDAFVVLPLLGATGLLGLVRPRDAWRWALLVGIRLPLGQAAALVTAMPLPYPNNWEGVAAVLAIALGLGVVGASAGALLRRFVGSAE
jgi:hypothetical protein